MELIQVQQIFLNYYERVDIYSLNKVSTGLINETFVVETNLGKYILQAINQYVFPDPNIGLSNIKLISEVLCESGLKLKSRLVIDASGHKSNFIKRPNFKGVAQQAESGSDSVSSSGSENASASEGKF